MRPFQQFFKTEAASGSVLLISALAAIAIANSPWSSVYARFWETPVSLSAGSHTIALSLKDWINDGLMAVFFLLVGLEIKRECLAGELASLKLAALPIVGALGGMILPAIIYAAFTAGGPSAAGWAIPMATDIAFALGVLALVAPGAPVGLRIFLSALAIVDDLGAVVTIALFYSAQLVWSALAAALAILAVLLVLNRYGVRQLTPYLALGLPLWWFVHESGIHATIAGVLLALAVPTRNRINAVEFSREARTLLDEFDRAETGDFLVLTSKGQQEALFALDRASEGVTEPLLRLEHALHSVAAFGIMPLFALANAGVPITGTMPEPDLAAGIILGLAVGKPVGITLASWLVVRGGYAALPPNVSWRALHACSWLGGIGFTMSIFVATLALEGRLLLEAAKTSVMAASFIAGIVGAILLHRSMSRR